jgi:ABC-2 type transport system ATP-binding protein
MRLLGHPVPAERAQALQRVGAIVEEPRFHPHLSGSENLRIIAAARGPEVRARIAPALARVGLSERADEKVKRYSLGMRQRLGVARCLLADPLLMILDEPTNGLDPGGIQEFREMIRSMVEQEGRTVFISSHLLDEVEKTCDAAAIVDRGKVVTQGTIAELAGGGTRPELILGVDDAELALRALEGSELVLEAHRSDEGLRVVLAGGPQTAAQLNTMLVSAGVGVMRLEPVRESLERRFLEITARLDAPADSAEVRA